MRSSPDLPKVRYALAAAGAGWELGEDTLPESALHDEAVALLEALLAAWAARRGDAFVVRNLAVRWDEKHPAFGVDPDVAVIVPRLARVYAGDGPARSPALDGEADRRAKDEAIAERDEALARVRELERELAACGGR